MKNFLVLGCATLIACSFTCLVNAQQEQFQAMAPENCWAFSFWDAAVEYDPNSKNETERLMAEPEVKEFIDDLTKRIGLLGPAMMSDQSPERQKLIRSIGPKLANIVFNRSGCFCLEKVSLSRDESRIRAKAFLCLDAGSDAKSLSNELSQLFSSDGRSPEKVTLSKIEFNKFLISEEPKFELLVGASASTLMLGIGEQAVTDALARVGGKKADWIKNLTSNKNTKRLTNFSYFNVKEIRDSVAPYGDPQTLMAVGIMGLGNVDSLETSAGLTEDRTFNRMLLKIDGRPEGLLDLYSQNGLQLQDLSKIPDDALFAFGLSLDLNRVFNMFRSFSTQMGGRDVVGRAIGEIKEETGVNFETELIDNLGDSWTIYNGAGDGWVSGLTLIGSVKSDEKLSAAVNKLIKKIIIETEGKRYGPKFKKRTVNANEVFSFQIKGTPFPFQPSWCISDDRIIVGLYPQAVEAALKKSSVQPLVNQAYLDKLATPFSTSQSTEAQLNSKLIAFGYSDTKTQFSISYPYAQMMLNMGQIMVDEMAVPPQSRATVSQLLNGIRLPPARTIHKHLGPSLVVARQSNQGIEIESTQTIPSIDAGYAVPVAIGMLLPAVQQVRGAARRTTSMNNLRQLALSAHNFESAYKSFPASYSIDDKGKKLLSWRVHLLPFLEQNNLYDQFKLDEPWDSDHNKKLIEKMPEYLRSPVSKAKPGMTTYRAIGGNSIIGAPTKPNRTQSNIGFGSITDGSSNTAMFIETSDELAEVWTKPDEGITAADLKKIFGSYPGGTNFAIGDGSVQFVSDKIDKTILSNLMQRNDGNIIDFNTLTGKSDVRRSRRNERNAEKATVDPFFNIGNGDVELTIDNLLSKQEKVELEKRKKLLQIREIGLAFHNFQSAHRSFPSAYTTSTDGKPLLSWRVHLLPFLDELELYKKFKLDEPWDSDNNIALLGKMPEIFNMGAGQLGEGETTVRAMGGPSGVISSSNEKGPRSGRGIRFRSITDGLSNTLMLVNVPDELVVEWSKPSEFDPADDAIKLILSKKFTAVICDGSMRTFPKGLTVEQFKQIWTRDGREIVDMEDLAK